MLYSIFFNYIFALLRRHVKLLRLAYSFCSQRIFKHLASLINSPMKLNIFMSISNKSFEYFPFFLKFDSGMTLSTVCGSINTLGMGLSLKCIVTYIGLRVLHHLLRKFLKWHNHLRGSHE